MVQTFVSVCSSTIHQESLNILVLSHLLILALKFTCVWLTFTHYHVVSKCHDFYNDFFLCWTKKDILRNVSTMSN